MIERFPAGFFLGMGQEESLPLLDLREVPKGFLSLHPIGYHFKVVDFLLDGIAQKIFCSLIGLHSDLCRKVMQRHGKQQEGKSQIFDFVKWTLHGD